MTQTAATPAADARRERADDLPKPHYYTWIRRKCHGCDKRKRGGWQVFSLVTGIKWFCAECGLVLGLKEN